MPGRTLMTIAWPGFLAACVLQLVVFAMVDPNDLHWAGEHVSWSRQAVYSAGFLLFWVSAMVSSWLTVLLGRPGEALDAGKTA
jgi:hypothetical protein